MQHSTPISSEEQITQWLSAIKSNQGDTTKQAQQLLQFTSQIVQEELARTTKNEPTTNIVASSDNRNATPSTDLRPTVDSISYNDSNTIDKATTLNEIKDYVHRCLTDIQENNKSESSVYRINNNINNALAFLGLSIEFLLHQSKLVNCNNQVNNATLNDLENGTFKQILQNYKNATTVNGEPKELNTALFGYYICETICAAYNMDLSACFSNERFILNQLMEFYYAFKKEVAEDPEDDFHLIEALGAKTFDLLSSTGYLTEAGELPAIRKYKTPFMHTIIQVISEIDALDVIALGDVIHHTITAERFKQESLIVTTIMEKVNATLHLTNIKSSDDTRHLGGASLHLFGKQVAEALIQHELIDSKYTAISFGEFSSIPLLTDIVSALVTIVNEHDGTLTFTKGHSDDFDYLQLGETTAAILVKHKRQERARKLTENMHPYGNFHVSMIDIADKLPDTFEQAERIAVLSPDVMKNVLLDRLYWIDYQVLDAEVIQKHIHNNTSLERIKSLQDPEMFGQGGDETLFQLLNINAPNLFHEVETELYQYTLDAYEGIVIEIDTIKYVAMKDFYTEESIERFAAKNN